MQFTRSLEVIAEPEVLVCGCGCAGTAAAISAARTGASTMVVEQWGFAGGFITAVVGPSLDGFVDVRSGLPIVGGLALEFARLSGGASGQVASERYQPSTDLRELWENPDWKPLKFDIELFKLYADRLMRQAGVRILYHTHIADVLRDGERVTGVVIVNKSGLGLVKPKMVIDATGDGDVATWAGAPFDIAEELQPMSLHFRVANVKISADLRDQCTEVLKQAQKAGQLDVFGGPWLNPLGPDELYVNATRYLGNGANPEDVSAAEIKGREDAHLMFELWQKHVPGFKNAYFVATGPAVGVRESRRIRGDKILSLDDIVNHREQADVVLMGAWYHDRHPQKSSGYHNLGLLRPYDIAYGTLLPRDLSNLWVAGRCHSADPEALASSRVTMTAMGMGQAAGTAAAMSVQAGTDSRGLKTTDLQAQLLADDVIILDRAEKIMAVGDALGDSVKDSILG